MDHGCITRSVHVDQVNMHDQREHGHGYTTETKAQVKEKDVHSYREHHN